MKPRHTKPLRCLFRKTLVSFLLPEMGDKTPDRYRSTGAQFDAYVWVVLGTTLGMSWPMSRGSFMGNAAATKFPLTLSDESRPAPPV